MLVKNSIVSRSTSLLVAAAVCLCASSSGLFAPAPASADVTFTVTGGGWGHGIGLSQYGAKGYADKGWTYGDIVRWYFGGDRDGSSSGIQVYTLEHLGRHANPTVKVNIDSANGTRDIWNLRSWKSRLRIIDASGAVTYLPKADTSYGFSVANGLIYVNGRRYSGTIRVSSESTTGVSPALVVVGNQSGPFDRQYVRYRREIQLTVVNGGLRAVNALPLEEYLYGVVPRESPSSWPAEALKAQAVVARSYAWASNPPSTTSTNTLSGILHCTTSSQVYGGHSRLVNGSDTNITRYETANAAVDGTRGRVVHHYPTKTIVQTFFSSASGGHTANIEDVWLTSTPKPYYRGVVDADQGSPDYRWDATYKTGAELATALRAKDGAVRDYSVAPPATVIGVSHERASSGYVRYATVRWSNGQSFKIRGDTMRSALGLKSTKFTIAGPVWGPVIQETDPKITWAGSWGTWASPLHSGGSTKYSWIKDSTATFKFSGSGFRWYSTTWAKGGRADVIVDGNRVATVSLYSPKTRYHQAVYTLTGLGLSSTHTATIKVLRTKEESSTGYFVGVDALRIQSGALVP